MISTYVRTPRRGDKDSRQGCRTRVVFAAESVSLRANRFSTGGFHSFGGRIKDGAIGG